MRVEKVAQCSILDLTWAQVKEILSNWRMHNRLESGLGLDHSDMIHLQKLADGMAGVGSGESKTEPVAVQKVFR
jgi:hypothetical protein